MIIRLPHSHSSDVPSSFSVYPYASSSSISYYPYYLHNSSSLSPSASSYDSSDYSDVPYSSSSYYVSPYGPCDVSFVTSPSSPPSSY